MLSLQMDIVVINSILFVGLQGTVAYVRYNLLKIKDWHIHCSL